MASTGKKPRQAQVLFDTSAGQPTQASSKSIRNARTLEWSNLTEYCLERWALNIPRMDDVVLITSYNTRNLLIQANAYRGQ